MAMKIFTFLSLIFVAVVSPVPPPPPPPPTFPDYYPFSHQCSPGVASVQCLVDPCQFASCENHPDAVCIADYCGGCNARFFLNGNEVTDTSGE